MSVYLEHFYQGLRSDPELSLSEWADSYRMLSSKASAEPGRWRTDRTPYLKEPMDCLSQSSPIQRVVMMFAAQSGKTECGNNFLGYVISHAPGPLLFVQPTVEMCRRLSKQRLESMITETPILSEKIAPARSRDSENTMFQKSFPGGMLLLTGTNSATGLRSTPCRYIFLDEIDAFPEDVDSEGSPIALAEKRATTFARRKILLTSTPTVKDFSPIESEFLKSDQRRYFVPCPACNEMQWLKWPQLKWENDDPTTAVYECEKCHERFAELHKPKMLREGEWRATAPFDGRTAGFHLSGLNSPLGWFSWEQMVDEFIEAKGDPPKLKTWCNTRLAETWEENYSSKVSAEGLLSRCENYEPGTVPEGVLSIVMGVDVQGGGGSVGDRLEVSIVGYGREEEIWLIDHQQLFGDPCSAEVWQQLDALISGEWKTSEGTALKPDVIAIDSGGHACHEVYGYARQRQGVGVIAIKGQSQKGKPAIGRPTRQDVNFRGRVLKKGVELFPMGSDTIKNTLVSRLKAITVPGPGYIHFPMLNNAQEYFEQLTAEKQTRKTNKSGFQVLEWVKKPGARNEALDCLVMSFCAYSRLTQIYDRRTMWEQFEKRLKDPNWRKARMNLKSTQQSAQQAFVRNW